MNVLIRRSVRRAQFVGTLLFKNHIDTSQETMADRAHDHGMVFALSTFTVVKGFELRVIPLGSRGG